MIPLVAGYSHRPPEGPATRGLRYSASLYPLETQMTPPMSLIDILEPPANQWLKELSKRKANLPAGVRVVRFSDEESEGADDLERAGAPARSG